MLVYLINHWTSCVGSCTPSDMCPCSIISCAILETLNCFAICRMTLKILEKHDSNEDTAFYKRWLWCHKLNLLVTKQQATKSEVASNQTATTRWTFYAEKIRLYADNDLLTLQNANLLNNQTVSMKWTCKKSWQIIFLVHYVNLNFILYYYPSIWTLPVVIGRAVVTLRWMKG